RSAASTAPLPPRRIARRWKRPWCRRWRTSSGLSASCWKSERFPVAIMITVPRLGWTMDEGTFSGWLKQDGDRVNPGDRLFALESDKATEEIEALDAGILRIPPDGRRPGDKVMVGQVLAHLVAEGEAAPAAPGGQPAVAAAAPEPAPRRATLAGPRK